MFAAELTTESSYHIIVDRDEDTLRRRTNELSDNMDSAVLDILVGCVDSDDIQESIFWVRMGQWSYK